MTSLLSASFVLGLVAGIAVAGVAVICAPSSNDHTAPRDRFHADTKFGRIACDRVEERPCGTSFGLCADLYEYSCLTDVRYERREMP